MNYCYSDNTKTLNNCQSKIPRVFGFYDPRTDRIDVVCPFCSTPEKLITHRHGPGLGWRNSHCGGGVYLVAVIYKPRPDRARKRPRRLRLDPRKLGVC